MMLHLRTLGNLSLFKEQVDQKVGNNELIILTHLLIDGPQDRNKLAERIWFSKREEFAEQGKSLAHANLRSALSRLRIKLRDLTDSDEDVLEESDRSTQISLNTQFISCDYTQLEEALENPESLQFDTTMQAKLEKSFLEGIEFNNRLDVKGEEDHPLYLWIQQKRAHLETKIDLIFAGKRLALSLAKQSVQSLLDADPSPKDLNDLFVFCSSKDYPHTQSQQRRDLDKLMTYLVDLFDEDLIADVSSNLVILALVALSGGKLKSLYVENAIDKFAELYTDEDKALEHWNMVEFLIDDGWLSESDTLQLKHSEIIVEWLNKHPRISSKLLQALLDVTPADETELLTELYTTPLEVIKHLAKDNSKLVFKASQENLKRGLPDRASELLNYGLQNAFQKSEHDYAKLLLAYAYEQLSNFQDALSLLNSITESRFVTVSPDAKLPSTFQDAQMMKAFAELKLGSLIEDTITQFELNPDPNDITWAEAKRFNIMGSYYMNQIDPNASDVFQKAIQYFTTAKDFWEQVIGNQDHVISELNNISICYAMKEDFEKAEALARDALSVVDKQNANSLSLLRTRYNLACIVCNQLDYSGSKNYQKALEHYDECYKVPFVQNYKPFVLRVYFDKGMLFEKQNQTERALEYYELARDLAIEIDDSGFRGASIASIGLLKQQMFLVNLGIKLLKDCGEFGEAEFYGQQIDKYFKAA